jgi:hypothetical protein
MAFIEAERTQLYLRCALFGPSGSGKTMTAMRIAKGIADKMGVPFAVIDTEARSASKYADRFKFVVDNLEAKTVDNYIASMNEAAKAGYKVLMIDSLSHAWRELTEEVDRITQASTSKNSFLSWAKVNPKQKRLIEAILNFPGHIIATMRSKTEWVIGEGKNGKSTPEKMGLAPEQGKGIEYEFDLLVELNQEHQGIISKDRTGKFQDEVIVKPGEEFGAALYDWLSSGNAALPPVSLPAAITQPEPDAADKIETTKSQLAKPEKPSKSSTAGYKADGEAVIKEIGEILNSASPKGETYFTDEERTDARQIVTTVKADAKGLKELRDFKIFLDNELTKRQPQKPAADKAA